MNLSYLKVLLGALCVLLLAGCAVQETRTQSVSSAAAQKFAVDLAAALRAGDQSQLIEMATREEEKPEFKGYPEATRREVYGLLGRHHLQRRNSEVALRYFESATALESATLADWRGRLVATNGLRRDRELVLCLINIGKRWPKSLTTMDRDGFVTSIVSTARRLGDEPLEFELMHTLYDANWRQRGHRTPGYAWRRYALMLMARGDDAKAKKVISRIDTYRDAIIVRVDRRFQPVRERFWNTPIAAVVDVEIANAEARAAYLSKSLEALHDLLSLLLLRGDTDKAIELASAAVVSAKANPKAFDDTDEQLRWTMDDLAIALFRAGRASEAIAQLEDANRQNSWDRASHAINLADAYCRTGRPADALRVLPTDPSATSEYGSFLTATVRLCAAIESGDRQTADALLSRMRETKKDAPLVYLNMLADMERREEFIAWLSELLQDERLRSDVLFNLQVFLPVAYSDFQRRRHARIEQYLADPAAVKAIAAVGERDSFDVFERLD